MRHQSDSVPIRVLVSDDTRVHTELLADALKRDGDLEVTTLLCGSDGLTSGIDFNDSDVLVMSSNLDEKPGRGFEILRGLEKPASRYQSGHAAGHLPGRDDPGSLPLRRTRHLQQKRFDRNLGQVLAQGLRRQIWANCEQISTLVEALASSHNIRAVDAKGLNLLSKRETEVVRGVAQGLSNREIAERLKLSQHTIKNCLFRIFDKLGVSSRVELLFMTLSQERLPQAPSHYFLNEKPHDILQDEGALIACQNAARRGVLLAQLALAQHYGSQRDPESSLQAYMWYSVASEAIGSGYKALAKRLTMEQLLQAEMMASERLNASDTLSGRGRAKPAPRLLTREKLRAASGG